MRPTNRAIAGLVVAVMLGMAALGLAFALQTVGMRRANDTKGAVPPEQVADDRPVPPAEWPGLGYLPDESQIVAGIRKADAMETAAGRAVLASLGISNKSMPEGLSPEDTESILVEVGNAHRFPPRLTVVARSKTAIDKSRIQAMLGNRPTIERHGKTLHRARLEPKGPEETIWQADGHTLVVALLPEDFDHIPAKPRTETPQPDLMKRLDPTALAWLVASVDETTAAFIAGVVHAPDNEPWLGVRALAISVRADGTKLKVTVDLRGRNERVGDGLAARVVDSLRKAGAAAERRAVGDWQQITATGDVDQLLNWLGKR